MILNAKKLSAEKMFMRNVLTRNDISQLHRKYIVNGESDSHSLPERYIPMSKYENPWNIWSARKTAAQAR